MSSDNAQFAVTYTSISSDSDGPSWGIPLMNVDELSKMDPYEEVSQEAQVKDQPHADEASLTTESPGYIVDLDLMGKDDDEDPEVDPSEEHVSEDDNEDSNEEPELEEEDTKEEKLSEDSDETEYRAYDQAPLGHRSAMIRMRDGIPEENMPPQRRFVFTAPSFGCDVAESSAAARAPRGHYDFVDTVEESEYFYTQLHDAQTDHRHIRLKIDVVRGQGTAYETELQENHACNKTRNKRRHNSRIHSSYDRSGNLKKLYPYSGRCKPKFGWRTQKACITLFHISGCAIDNQVKFATCTLLGATLTWWNGHVRTLGHDVAYAMTWGTLKKKLMNKYRPKAYTQCFQELALMCPKFLADETKKVDKYISGLLDNIHGNVMSARPKTLDETIKLANDLMDQKLHTYTERQNDNKRKANDSSRNNQQQQPHKKQNVARAYTAGPGEKKAYTGNLPLCTKCNYHYTRKCAPKCNNCKKYGHATRDCRVNVNNNNNNNNNRVQSMGTCFECGEPGHFKKNCPELKNNGNENRNGVNTLLRGCTLDFLNHPFNIDLMPIPLGSFDVIICMDWLREYHTAQKYLSKGCDVFLAHVTIKEAKDKSEGKQLEDMSIVRDFLEVFPKDLLGIPPA
nr:hypothetical protein [Tanacetum cinerariifolium]